MSFREDQSHIPFIHSLFPLTRRLTLVCKEAPHHRRTPALEPLLQRQKIVFSDWRAVRLLVWGRAQCSQRTLLRCHTLCALSRHTGQITRAQVCVCVCVDVFWLSVCVCVCVCEVYYHIGTERSQLFRLRTFTTENYRGSQEREGDSALRPNFPDIVPHLIAKIPPSLLPSLPCGSAALRGKKEAGF